MPNGPANAAVTAAVSILTVAAIGVGIFVIFRKQILGFFPSLFGLDEEFSLFVAPPSPQEIADILQARRGLTSQQSTDFITQYNLLIQRTRQITADDRTVSDAEAWERAQQELGRLPKLPPITN